MEKVFTSKSKEGEIRLNKTVVTTGISSFFISFLLLTLFRGRTVITEDVNGINSYETLPLSEYIFNSIFISLLITLVVTITVFLILKFKDNHKK